MALRTVLAILAVTFLSQRVNCIAIRLPDWKLKLFQEVVRLPCWKDLFQKVKCTIWQAFDQDGSGSIDGSELRLTVEAVFRMSGVKLREKEVQECVAEIQGAVKDGRVQLFNPADMGTKHVERGIITRTMQCYGFRQFGRKELFGVPWEAPR